VYFWALAEPLVLYGLAVRSYVAALVWVAVGCALYGWQILSLAVR
jgi:hypothetical protein